MGKESLNSETPSHQKGSKFILYGIITGVILGFLAGWWLGPTLMERKDTYQSVLITSLESFDKNNDGKVTLAEASFLEKILPPLDRDKDKALYLKSEFSLEKIKDIDSLVEKTRKKLEELDEKKLIESLKQIGEIKDAARRRGLYEAALRDAFKVIDQNRNGKLSPRESKELFGEAVALLDRDKDEAIYYLHNEFDYFKLSATQKKYLRKSLKKKLQEKSGQEKLLTRLDTVQSKYASIHTWFELFDLFGELFLNALKMLIVPLIITTMIGGVTALGDIRKLGKVGGYTIIYYTITTGLAVCVGILVVTIIEPGTGTQIDPLAAAGAVQEKDLSLFAVIKGFVHPNIVGAMVELEMLPLIIFSLVLGGILSTMGEKSKTTIDVITCLGEAIMQFVILIMYLAPIGIFGLLAYKVGMAGGSQGFGEELKRLGWYAFSVILALVIHGFVIIPLIYFFIVKKNPLAYLYGMLQALMTAFSTASSAATLPLTMESVEKNNGVSNRAASFVCPLGATINMDGTALYEAVAAIFIAQLYGIHIGGAEQLIIFLTATLAAIGAAGIPEAGLVTMVIVLEAVGLPLEGITMILVIDWFLDRCRTTINVWGDSVGAAVIDAMVIQKDGSPS